MVHYKKELNNGPGRTEPSDQGIRTAHQIVKSFRPAVRERQQRKGARFVSPSIQRVFVFTHEPSAC
jgi:hypothetical protein